ncbi:MAG: uracil-DNA glycosylase [Pseudomonadota bacterium]
MREDLAAALAWQIELGADEAIAEAPQDRFEESRPNSAPAKPPAPTAQKAAPPAAARQATPEAAFPSAAALAGRATTLEDLSRALAEWQGSDLRKGARNCVFADGRPGAPVMVIGEAPGADEDRLGKPFVGRAGQLLDRMLGAIGLSRDAEDLAKAVYITNILPWRPPGNRTPSEQETAAFLPFVERHIALAGPKVLLTIGNTPTKTLLATTQGIRRMRGNWQTHGASGLPLLPSFHPAYLLRQPAEKAQAWRDLLALQARLEALSGNT